jgi:hypothetical protein
MTRPTATEVAEMISTSITTDAAARPGSVAPFSQTISNPPTQAQVQAIVIKLNELLTALLTPV